MAADYQGQWHQGGKNGLIRSDLRIWHTCEVLPRPLLHWLHGLSRPHADIRERLKRRDATPQKKLVKLKSQRNARKRESATRPKAYSPYEPARIFGLPECSMVHMSFELVRLDLGVAFAITEKLLADLQFSAYPCCC